MPKIRSSADLRNNYNEISTFCHDYAEPVFITKNGKGDLAVMSIETYEALTARFDLYAKLQECIRDRVWMMWRREERARWMSSCRNCKTEGVFDELLYRCCRFCSA